MWNDNQTSSEKRDDGAGMSVDEKLRLWNSEGATDPQMPVEYPPDIELRHQEDETQTPNYMEARAFLVNHPSLQWAIDRLRCLLVTAVQRDATILGIRQTVADGLERHYTNTNADAHIRLILPVREFLQRHAYLKDAEHHIGAAVTVCGSSDNAYATTCAEYAAEVWGAQGTLILDQVQAAHDSGHGSTAYGSKCTIQGAGSNAHFHFHGDELEVTYLGCNTSIMVALAEQLAWLECVMRLMPRSSGIVARRARATLIRASWPEGAFGIRITSADTNPEESEKVLQASKCWHSLFRDVNLVYGFPIRSRANQEPGLELGLDLMVSLSDVDWATVFDDRLVLKGWSTLLTPTAQLGESVVWHLTQRDDQKRMPYTSIDGCHAHETVANVRQLGWSGLEKARHFLGWCSVSQVLLGKSF